MNLPPGKLEGKIAMITGGASGLGLAIAEKYISQGARVVLVDLNAELMKLAEDRLGEACATVKTNVV
ncbi:MAG: SDR family NAD(P)-dependent oxidoreductase, partial [bacterium]|nr:SDR family NAD(P)-dependent oxidoreductase [bacterium]